MIGGCVRDLPHRYDPDSGWWRDDGRSQYRLRAPIPHMTDFTEPRRREDA